MMMMSKEFFQYRMQDADIGLIVYADGKTGWRMNLRTGDEGKLMLSGESV